jgi:uncharacterized protein YndB with AHSA1/START domain
MKTRRFDTVEVVTPSDTEIRMLRSFDAPRDLVWEAWTNPKLVPKWLLGPEDWAMPVCEIDLRVGGQWHYLWRHTDGRSLEMRGRYLEIARPERLVSTESWGADWPETVNTLVLEEDGGVTIATQTIRCESRDDRDARLKTGMADGVEMSYQHLQDLLRSRS